MCLLAIAWRCHPRHDLVFVGNRDEFYERPTAPAAWWSAGAEPLFGGRDLQAGGTWLGMREDGTFATVTNVREAHARRQGERSRGHLITRVLQAPDAFGELDSLLRDGERYAHYNLLVGQLAPAPQLAYLNNVEGKQRLELPPGIYVLSNHRLDTPWPKAERIRDSLTALIAEPSQAPDDQALIDALLAIMSDRDTAPDHTLPATGLPLDRERALSPPFIDTQGYGTRATTVVLASTGGEARFVEESFAARSAPIGRVDQRWTLAAAR